MVEAEYVNEGWTYQGIDVGADQFHFLKSFCWQSDGYTYFGKVLLDYVCCSNGNRVIFEILGLIQLGCTNTRYLCNQNLLTAPPNESQTKGYKLLPTL